jgi:hypothetical protein
LQNGKPRSIRLGIHHTPLENVIKILISQELKSRTDSEHDRERDVAAEGVIDARDHAHKSARLYFRPRTPTQFHIEGIRKNNGDYKYAAHAPVLFMMIFDARRVLALPNIKFCDRNMQLGGAETGDTEEYFAKIPFEKVYHEGNIGGDRSIIDHRHAEVLATSPLSLKDNLQWVYCRSHAERDTLLHFLGNAAPKWAKQLIVSDDILVFQKRCTFVEHVELTTTGIIFQLHQPENNLEHKVKISLWDNAGIQIINSPDMDLKPKPDAARRWQTSQQLTNGSYLAQIEIEGHLAYKARLSLGDQLV